MEPVILFVSALGWEAKAALNAAGVRGSRNEVLWRASDRPVYVLTTGMGEERTRHALARAARIVRPSMVIASGCAGALTSSVCVGDVVIASEVIGPDGEVTRSDPELACAYLAACATKGVSAFSGRVVTSRSVVLEPERKALLGRETDALAVDMESAVVARWAEAERAAFVAVRAVLDPVALRLPDLRRSIGPDGRLRVLPFLGFLARNPGSVSVLRALAFARRTCARSLLSAHREWLAGHVVLDCQAARPSLQH